MSEKIPDLSRINVDARRQRTAEHGPSNPNYDGSSTGGFSSGGLSNSSIGVIEVQVKGAGDLYSLGRALSSVTTELTKLLTSQYVFATSLVRDLDMSVKGLSRTRFEVLALSSSLRALQQASRDKITITTASREIAGGQTYESFPSGVPWPMNPLDPSLRLIPTDAEKAAGKSITDLWNELDKSRGPNALPSTRITDQEIYDLAKSIKPFTKDEEDELLKLSQRERVRSDIIEERIALLPKLRWEQALNEDQDRRNSETSVELEKRLNQLARTVNDLKDEYSASGWELPSEEKLLEEATQRLDTEKLISEETAKQEEAAKRLLETQEQQRLADEKKYADEVGHFQLLEEYYKDEEDLLMDFNRTKATYGRTVGARYENVGFAEMYRLLETGDLEKAKERWAEMKQVMDDNSVATRTLRSEHSTLRQGMMQLSISTFVVFITMRQAISSLEAMTKEGTLARQAVDELGGSFVKLMPFMQLATSVSQMLNIQLTAMTGKILALSTGLASIYMFYKAITAEGWKMKAMYGALAAALLVITVITMRQTQLERARQAIRAKAITSTWTEAMAATALASVKSGWAAPIAAGVALATVGAIVAGFAAYRAKNSAFTMPGEERSVNRNGYIYAHAGEKVYTPAVSGRKKSEGGNTIIVQAGARIDRDSMRRLSRAVKRGI